MIDVRGTLPKHPTEKYARRKVSDIDIIAIHHSLTTEGSPEAFANHHINVKGWPGIAYHYVIAKNGTVYICHDIETESYHVGRSNRRSIGIVMVGDFRTEQPTEIQYKACLKLVRDLLGIVPNAQIKGHSELPGYDWKQCPVISMDQFRRDVGKGEYKMSPDDANKIIAFLSAGWFVCKDKASQDEFKRLADELRKVSGQVAP
jgi:N-acetylmuramoyl-L-alanine amidase